MSVTQHLNITEVQQNQNNRYITINNGFEAVAAATNAKLSKVVSGVTPVTLNLTECTRYVYYVAESGASGPFDFIFLGEFDVNNAERLFVFKNATAYTATVKTDGVGTTVAVPAGTTCLIHQAHDDMVKLTELADVVEHPYDVGLFLPGQPADNVTAFVFTAVRSITFPDDFAGSVGTCGTNPTSVAAFDVLKNGASVGSISISTAGVFTFATTGASLSLAAGDRLSLNTPTPQDATLANVSIVFKGTRA